MDANEIEHRKKMQGIIQRIPTGIPDGWEKTTYAVGGGNVFRLFKRTYREISCHIEPKAKYYRLPNRQ